MNELTIGNRRYCILAAEKHGVWSAHAERLDTGDPFGVQQTAATEAEAVERVARWLDWQSQHAAALEALQHAERAYHRAIAGSAFASPTEGPAPVGIQKQSLQQVEAARLRLDEVREGRPE
jgi:hypothetical protein